MIVSLPGTFGNLYKASILLGPEMSISGYAGTAHVKKERLAIDPYRGITSNGKKNPQALK